MTSGDDRSRRFLTGAVAGLVALLVFLGVAEIIAVATGPDSAPTIAIGQKAISHTPLWLKNVAIAQFGESDKTALLVGIYATLGILAAVAGGVAALTRRAVALVALTALGIVAAVSAAKYPGAGPLAIAPSLVAAVVSAYVFGTLIHDRAAVPAGAELPPGADGSLSRRGFVLAGGAMAGFGAAAYAVGRIGLQGAYSAALSRSQVRLPSATSTDAMPAGPTGFDIPGLSSYITPAESFYRVDTALVVPQVQPEKWSLRIHGLVSEPLTLTYDDILAMPMIERAVTLACVSDPVGGPYIGTARWTGTLLKPILDRVGISPAADQLFMTSVDGMTIGGDLAAATDGRDSMLVVGMNGAPLPFEHGFPVRMIVPGQYGYVSACKWLTDIEVTTYAARQAYWVPRGYAAKAPIKLESRIDTPSPGSRVQAGVVPVAGVAWRQHVGISRVEVRIDAGPWRAAQLADVDSTDTWRLWRYDWQATAGRHLITVRATDAEGNLQTTEVAQGAPNGAAGLEVVEVTVSA